MAQQGRHSQNMEWSSFRETEPSARRLHDGYGTPFAHYDHNPRLWHHQLGSCAIILDYGSISLGMTINLDYAP